ncbi:hypothetical protein HYZ99_05015 [Candidatus Peregrinibacteria bacterium]|nr:hypothetical protein [Candidatus Peregrinibacteria bacterium]
MSDSWLDLIPSREREKIRKRMCSPEAYAALREKVKGPEDLEREMEHNEAMAELRFEMETEPALKEALKKQVEKDAREQGIDHVLEYHPSKEAKASFDRGAFHLSVESHPDTHLDQLIAIPEGKVQEKLPIRVSLCNRYLAQFVRGM